MPQRAEMGFTKVAVNQENIKLFEGIGYLQVITIFSCAFKRIKS